MEVLNKTQRRSAYWFFVLFFLITVAVLITAVFFNAYFPFKENSLLKTENAKMKKEMEKVKNVDMKELEAGMKKLSAEMKELGPKIEEEMKKAKLEIEKAKAEIREYKVFVDGLDSDGLINKKDGYTLKHKDGVLLINGKKASDGTYNKYREFLEKHPKFNLNFSEDNDEVIELN